jgi:hypothetical protein
MGKLKILLNKIIIAIAVILLVLFFLGILYNYLIADFAKTFYQGYFDT